MTEPRSLLLGLEWFPDSAGGLNRYFRELRAALGGPHAVVLGPAADAAARVHVPADSSQPLLPRLWRYRAAAAALAPDADVVDAHFALTAAAALTARSVRRLPLVVHFQGPWADESASVGQRSRLRIAAKHGIERAVYRRAREIVVLSAPFKRILVERYGVEPWRVEVVGPGVDTERFSPGARSTAREALALPREARIVLSVRRLVPRMGLDVLLDAWEQLPPLPRQPLLLIAGDGPERPALEARAATMRARDSVRLLGRVSDDALVDLYRAADLTVVPSVALEGFGLVVLESLACGTPVLTSDTDGLRDAVVALEPALVVPAGDAAALAERITAVMTDAANAPSAEDCRRHAEARSWEPVADGNREVYRRALTEARREPIRAVFIDHCARLSGGELALLRLLPALEDVEAHVILGEDGPLVSRLLDAGVSVEVLPLRRAARDLPRDDVRPSAFPVAGAAFAVEYAVRLALRLRRLRPDVVHTNSLKAALYGGIAAKAAGLPVVWHLRDTISEDYLPRPAVALVRAFARRVPDLVIANSQHTLTSVGPQTVRSTVIHDAALGREPHLRPPAGPFVVGMVGRISPWKGQHIFLEAFARAFPHSVERAVIVGAPIFGEDEYWQDVQRLPETLGIAGRVEFRGFREDVGSELDRIDALVHASVIPEPFGQVVVEGMAAGLPVVAANAGGPAEVVEDGVNGLLYPPGDVAGLASALRRLSSDRELRVSLGAAGRVKAAEFTPKTIAAQVSDAYEALLRH